MNYRPVILIGNGARANPALVEHLCSLGVPVLTTWPALDLVTEDNPVFCGRPGIIGQRAANIIVQKATHLYVFGARLDEGTTGFGGYEKFAPDAQIRVYDCDVAERAKLPKRYICMDADLSVLKRAYEPEQDTKWLSWCRALYDRFRPELDGRHAEPGYIDPHGFIRELSNTLQANDVVVSGAGQAGEVLCQSLRVVSGMRMLTLSNYGAMGYDIPLSIGAARRGAHVLCVTGDGGFQLNIHDLETARREKLNITFFVFNNGGYGSIRNMQNARFDGRRVACDAYSGYTTPPLGAIARCYALPFYSLSTTLDIHALPDERRTRIVEVPIDPNWTHLPRVMSSLVDGRWRPDPLHDMTPKLDPDELKRIMEE